MTFVIILFVLLFLRFLAFINLYMNDLIYLLDECLEKLKDIKAYDDNLE